MSDHVTSFGKKHITKYIKFALVGTVGVLVNGLVFSTLSRFEAFTLSPIDGLGLGHYLSYFRNITWAWGCGILAAFTFNYFMNYYWTFQDKRDKRVSEAEK